MHLLYPVHLGPLRRLRRIFRIQYPVVSDQSLQRAGVYLIFTYLCNNRVAEAVKSFQEVNTFF